MVADATAMAGRLRLAPVPAIAEVIDRFRAAFRPACSAIRLTGVGKYANI
jgi:hypothetical protein